MKENKIDISNEMLYEKISNEYNNYLNDLKTKDIDYIIGKSYETSIKEGIVELFDPSINDRDIEEVQTLFGEKNLLNFLYDSWLKNDYSISEMLEESLWYDIETLKEKYESENRKVSNSKVQIER